MLYQNGQGSCMLEGDAAMMRCKRPFPQAANQTIRLAKQNESTSPDLIARLEALQSCGLH